MIQMNRKSIKAAFIRAVYTMAETTAAMLGAETIVETIDPVSVILSTLLAGILSIGKSLSIGMPEVNPNNIDEEDDERGAEE